MSTEQYINDIDLLFGDIFGASFFIDFAKIESVVTLRHESRRRPANIGHILIILEIDPLVDTLAMHQEYLKTLVEIELLFPWGASNVHLGKLFEIDYTVMVLQYGLEGIGLDFAFFSPVAELMLDWVVEVDHQ